MKKGKGVVIAAPNPPSGDESSSEGKNVPALPTGRSAARNASSKYDFVKVKVWLGDNADHYYVLSRFLLSRMLTVTKIPNHVAIKIALELKKLLIDNSLLDVSQSDLEANLFKLMERRGYGEEYINRYNMMTRFHHQRVPLVILICGTACTDMVYELLRTSTDAPLVSTPVWARDYNSSEELITEFCRECRIVRKGLAGDLKKAMKDGKPIIIEGIHLDPSIYLMDEENRERNSTSVKNEEPNLVPPGTEDNNAVQKEPTSESAACKNGNTSTNCRPAEKPEVELPTDEVTTIAENLESIDLATSAPGDQGHVGEVLKTKTNPPAKNEKSPAEPVIIPIVLNMAEFDHKALLEEWISTRTFGEKFLAQDKKKLINNLKTIQDYLCSFDSQGLTVVNISATTFPQTLDWLHGYLLQCIERGSSSASTVTEKQQNEG
ncbi:uncharacterized protein LOC113347254 isoform X2 [Papaver somniferum]|uniref:uncharacterized protein LOC113347254 isoform X2 n=1 Tax=Papaver somniferum TaxID=3469 RepID=UPI000E6FF011|nr:uncharacterized protein LOC113347254 isoform X2 [Papaver somniferum]